MKIAIPVVDNSEHTTISSAFGRAPYFLIYDTNTGEKHFVENQVARSSEGGAGVVAGQLIVDSGVKAVLTPQCGANAASVITAAGIKIYKTEGDSVKDAVAQFQAGKLAALKDIHKGFHHRGGI
ncbi:MAG: dinitrogenase iron-molybdenum cofactor biosynthesis protein [Firmicutes bacterium]|jgi:predicted Fe-Mo cluster-binding NifX family protein|nr:NifB/NifX family molybdenum-iron cluster-binding protein [Bacillota bacterium]NLL89161.1 dinitrogenase iron-molybdenum cofactor biosynthesis protein [Bacillota bacterium]HKM17798.1 NifB/NifX family molybdenum-iron cluster-binding protein [Limnochordia bacterium]